MSYFSTKQTYEPWGDDDDSQSEPENNSSSEDDIDIILNGTPEQKRRLQQRHKKTQAGYKREDDASSSDDEFEREMKAELDEKLAVLERSRSDFQALVRVSQSGQASTSPSSSKGKRRMHQTKDVDDEVGFGSDEEGGETSGQKTGKHKPAAMSNDDLLYDPKMDDEDQKWVDSQRQKHRSQTHLPAVKGGKNAKIPGSDALLDCPACLTTLSIDCQRHELYKHQYRAMFVMNCVVDQSEQLQCPEQTAKKKKKHGEGDKDVPSDPTSDLFHPVRCTECHTVVGVIDHDEVYHFFNVLASHT